MLEWITDVKMCKLEQNGWLWGVTRLRATGESRRGSVFGPTCPKGKQINNNANRMIVEVPPQVPGSRNNAKGDSFQTGNKGVTMN